MGRSTGGRESRSQPSPRGKTAGEGDPAALGLGYREHPAWDVGCYLWRGRAESGGPARGGESGCVSPPAVESAATTEDHPTWREEQSLHLRPERKVPPHCARQCSVLMRRPCPVATDDRTPSVSLVLVEDGAVQGTSSRVFYAPRPQWFTSSRSLFLKSHGSPARRLLGRTVAAAWWIATTGLTFSRNSLAAVGGMASRLPRGSSFHCGPLKKAVSWCRWASGCGCT